MRSTPCSHFSPIALKKPTLSKRIRFSTSSRQHAVLPIPRSTVVSTIGCLATRPAWFRRCARRSSSGKLDRFRPQRRMSPPSIRWPAELHDHVPGALEIETRTVGKNLTMEAGTTPPSDELKSLWNHQKEISERLTDKAALISTKEMHRAVMLVMADRLTTPSSVTPTCSCDEFLEDLKIVQHFPGCGQRQAFRLRPGAGSDLADGNLRLPYGRDGVRPSAFRGAFARAGRHPRAWSARRTWTAAADDPRGARHLPCARRHPEAQWHQGRPPLHHLLHQERRIQGRV